MDHGDQEMTARISDEGRHKTIHGHGNGPVDGLTLFVVGIDKNIVVASLKAVVSGVNRALKR